jgi:hypothetical protein
MKNSGEGTEDKGDGGIEEEVERMRRRELTS